MYLYCQVASHNLIVLDNEILLHHRGCLIAYNPKDMQWRLRGLNSNSEDLLFSLDGTVYGYKHKEMEWQPGDLDDGQNIAKYASVKPVSPVPIARMLESVSDVPASARDARQWLLPTPACALANASVWSWPEASTDGT